MRLLIVGTLKGQLTTATKIAMDNGASVTHAEAIEQAMAVLRGGKGADLLLVDVALDIRELVMRLEAEHNHGPSVSCGTPTDPRTTIRARNAKPAGADDARTKEVRTASSPGRSTKPAATDIPQCPAPQTV